MEKVPEQRKCRGIPLVACWIDGKRASEVMRLDEIRIDCCLDIRLPLAPQIHRLQSSPVVLDSHQLNDCQQKFAERYVVRISA